LVPFRLVVRSDAIMRAKRTDVQGRRLRNDDRTLARPDDIVDTTFGRLTVTRYVGRDSLRRHLYECVCACGNTTLACRDALIVRVGKKSCGCSRRKPSTWKGCGDISGSFWRAIQRGASKRGVTFTLQIKEAWALFEVQEGQCALSGVPIGFARTTSQKGRTASLDRIDSTNGYEAGNVQWVHKDVNVIRGSLTVSEFIQWCDRVSSMTTDMEPA